jgi:hypothetical protein
VGRPRAIIRCAACNRYLCTVEVLLVDDNTGKTPLGDFVEVSGMICKNKKCRGIENKFTLSIQEQEP